MGRHNTQQCEGLFWINTNRIFIAFKIILITANDSGIPKYAHRPLKNLQREIAQITTLSHVFFSGFDIQAATVQLS